MSTPVSIPSPPVEQRLRTDSEQERDLQAKMQHLIRLQHTAYYNNNNNTTSTGSGLDEMGGGDNIEYNYQNSNYGTTTTTTNTNNNNNTNSGYGTGGVGRSSTSSLLAMSKRSNKSNNTGGGISSSSLSLSTKTPNSSLRDPIMTTDTTAPPIVQLDQLLHQDVGRGTLVFSGNLLRDVASRNHLSSSPTDERDSMVFRDNNVDVRPPNGGQQQQQQQQQQQLQQQQQQTFQSSSSLQRQQQQQQSPHIAMMMYSPGATTSTSAAGHKPMSRQQQQQYTPLPPQQIYAGYGSVESRTHHEYHYGIDRPMDDDDDDIDNNKNNDNHSLFKGRGGGGGGGQRRRLGRTNSSCCERFCCLYRPIIQLLSQENLHRSFCYGAIDGILTGSGIVSALWGLGILHTKTILIVRIAVVGLSVSACMADAVCMAVGHVWTSYVVTSHRVQERSVIRSSLEHNKADSKGKLVDMLLARGMLKIDAMSLADTLEGYPDLFVSALVGDSLLSGTDEIPVDDETTDDNGGYSYHQQQLPYQPNPLAATGSGVATITDLGNTNYGGSWRFPSYAQFNSERHHDSETNGTVNAVYRESQKEGFFMMLGFAAFATLPSLLWLVLPLWLGIDPPPLSLASTSMTTMSPSQTPIPSSSSLYTTTHEAIHEGGTVSLPSLVIFLLTIVISCLGVWKSRFVDSNWAVFAIETTAVLLVCVSTSYGLASLLYRTLLQYYGMDDVMDAIIASSSSSTDGINPLSRTTDL